MAEFTGNANGSGASGLRSGPSGGSGPGCRSPLSEALSVMSGTIRLSSHEVYYEAVGEGEPLILVHSGMGSVREWDFVRPLLWDRFALIAYDRSGIGRSTGVPFQPDIVEGGAEELEEVLDHLGIREASIFGSCVGGAIALVMASRFPGRIRSIISSDALFHGDEGLKRRLQTMLRPWDGMPPPFRETLARLQGHAEPRDFYETFRSMYGSDESDAGYASSPSYDIRDRLSKVACPVRFVHGDRDPFWGVEQPAAVYRTVRKGSLHVVPECAHYPHLEYPEEMAAMATRFLADEVSHTR